MLVAMFAMSTSAVAQEYASVTSVSPAEGTISLDGHESGSSQINIIMDGVWDADVYAESVEDVAAKGIVFTTPSGDTSSPRALYMWQGASNIAIQFADANAAFKTPGTYTLYVPANLNTINGKGNPEVNYTWTVTAATKFEIDDWNNVEANGTQAEGAYPWDPFKSLTGFTISAPDGVTFDYLKNGAKLQTKEYNSEGGGYVYTDVDGATVAIIEGKVVITLGEAITAQGHYSYVLPEGTIFATDGKYNKEVSFSADVDPYVYFSVTTNPADGATVEGPVTSLDIIIPDGITVTGLSESTVNFGGWPLNAESWQQNDNIVTLTFPVEKAIPVGTINTQIVVPQGLLITTDPYLTNRSEYVYNICVVEPVVYMTVEKLTTAYPGEDIASGSTVDQLSYFYIYLNEPLAENDITPPDGITLSDANGDTYGISYAYCYADAAAQGYGEENNAMIYAKLSDINGGALKAAGTYTLHIPAGAYTSANGHPSEEINYTFVIEDKTITFSSAEINDTKGGMGYATITFDNEVLVKSNYPDNNIVTLYKGSDVVALDINYIYLQGANNLAYLYIYNNSYNTFWPLEVGDYTLRIDGSCFTSVTGKVYGEDYINIPFTVTAPATISLSAESEGKFYATYYDGSHNWIVPDGVTAYVSESLEGNSVVLTEAAAAGEVVSASTAVLLVSESAIAAAPLNYAIASGAYYDYNLFRGTSTNQLIENSTWEDDPQYTFYLLSTREGKLGFYWDASTQDEGASLNNAAHKAYLRVPVDNGGSSNGYKIRFDEYLTTGINAIATENSEAIYNLQGQRVNATKAGVYVKNGRKVIVK